MRDGHCSCTSRVVSENGLCAHARGGEGNCRVGNGR